MAVKVFFNPNIVIHLCLVHCWQMQCKFRCEFELLVWMFSLALHHIFSRLVVFLDKSAVLRMDTWSFRHKETFWGDPFFFIFGLRETNLELRKLTQDFFFFQSFPNSIGTLNGVHVKQKLKFFARRLAVLLLSVKRYWNVAML